jgi:hypothetical protein
MRGVPIKAVQELLGHAKVEMTMMYAHLTPDAREDAVGRLDDDGPGLGPMGKLLSVSDGHPTATRQRGAKKA